MCIFYHSLICSIKVAPTFKTVILPHTSVADPGFPVGGGAPNRWGAPTSDVYTFCQKRMRKRKKLILLGGGGGGGAGSAPPGSANALSSTSAFEVGQC